MRIKKQEPDTRSSSKRWCVSATSKPENSQKRRANSSESGVTAGEYTSTVGVLQTHNVWSGGDDDTARVNELGSKAADVGGTIERLSDASQEIIDVKGKGTYYMADTVDVDTD